MTMASLVDKSMPAVVALYDTILCGKGCRQGGSGRTLFFNITCGLPSRVPLTNLVELDRDVYPYLTALMVDTLI